MDNRVKLSGSGRTQLFGALLSKNLTVDSIAGTLKVSSRSIRDWRKGKFTISRNHFMSLCTIANINPQEVDLEELPAWWHTSRAGQKGGRVFIERHKTLGDISSRQKGGRSSYSRRHTEPASIYTRKSIQLPGLSSELAEFVGILMGDGGITPYQVTITLDSKTDKAYSMYVTQLAYRLFKIKPAIYYRPKARCIILSLSSVELVEYLVSLGLPCGHKLRHGLAMPQWITKNKTYVKSCVRGLFDTDGSIYQEVHYRKDKTYAYSRLSLVSLSSLLREEVYRVLTDEGISAKIQGRRCVVIGRFTDVQKYFRIIGSSNPKHLERWVSFGGVG